MFDFTPIKTKQQKDQELEKTTQPEKVVEKTSRMFDFTPIEVKKEEIVEQPKIKPVIPSLIPEKQPEFGELLFKKVEPTTETTEKIAPKVEEVIVPEDTHPVFKFFDDMLKATTEGLNRSLERLKDIPTPKNERFEWLVKPIEKITTEAFGKAATSIPETLLDTTKRLKAFEEIQKTGVTTDEETGEQKYATKADKLGKGIEVGVGAANTAFIPITSIFSAAKEVPGLNIPVETIEWVFGKAGEVGTFAGDKLLNALPISDEDKQSLALPVAELTGLVGMIVLGGSLFKGVKKGTEITKEKYKDLKYLQTQALLEQYNQSIRETLGEMKTETLMDKTMEKLKIEVEQVKEKGETITPEKAQEIVDKVNEEVLLKPEVKEEIKVEEKVKEKPKEETIEVFRGETPGRVSGDIIKGKAEFGDAPFVSFADNAKLAERFGDKVNTHSLKKSEILDLDLSKDQKALKIVDNEIDLSKEQVKKLNELGYKAISFNNLEPGYKGKEIRYFGDFKIEPKAEVKPEKESLETEAKKHDTVEDFVNSLDILYEDSYKGDKSPEADRLLKLFGEKTAFHGTDAAEQIKREGYKKGSYWNSGIHFSDTPDIAIDYMKQRRSRTGGEPAVLVNDLSNLKIYKAPKEITVYSLFKGDSAKEELVTKLKKEGYDGMKDTTGETLVWNVEKIKTPKTLTDIWNEAQKTKKTEVKKVEQESLETEAIKYESVEEFVKAQGTLVYHGGTEIKEVGNMRSKWGAFYMTDNPTYAKSYGGNKSFLNEMVIMSEAKLADLRKPSSDIVKQIEDIISPKKTGKTFKIQKPDGSFIEVPETKGGLSNPVHSSADIIQGIKDGKAYYAEMPEVKKALKKLGYDGMITQESKFGANYGVWNKNVIKTKSQLEEIWKKAQGVIKTAPKEVIKESPKKETVSYEKRIDNLIEKEKNLTKTMDKYQRERALKGIGMEYAGYKRAIEGKPTQIEKAKTRKYLESNHKGKEVEVAGKQGTLTGKAAFGSHEIIFKDGTKKFVKGENIRSEKITDKMVLDYIKDEALKKIKGKEDLYGIKPEKEVKKPEVKIEVKPTEKVKKEVEPKKPETKEQKEKKKFQSRVYERMQAEYADILKDDLTYERMNLKKDAEKAVKLIEKDKQEAYEVATGMKEPPEGQTSTAVNIALTEKALAEGNNTLAADLIKNRSLAQTRRGQEIVAEKGSISDNSVNRYVKELINARMETLKTYTFDIKKTKRKTKKQQVMEKVDKEVAKAKKKIKNKELDLEEAQKLIDSIICK